MFVCFYLKNIIILHRKRIAELSGMFLYSSMFYAFDYLLKHFVGQII